MNQGMRDLLNQIASDAPVPGGGSVSALGGALGAALAAMVWRLTEQKRPPEAGRLPAPDDAGASAVGSTGFELEALIREADDLRGQLVAGFDLDAASYEGVLTGFRLPKETEEQKVARREAIEAAMQHATLVPLENARLCARVLDLATRSATEGYQPSVTDGGVGAVLAFAGVTGCLYNVELNLQSVKDEDFAARVRAEAESLRAEAGAVFAAADRAVLTRIAE